MSMKKYLIVLLLFVTAIVTVYILCLTRHADIEIFNATVNVESVEVKSSVGGKIKSINVSDNNEVKKGQLIAEIETVLQPQRKIISQDESEADYENIAIMYKDGVISKEEYDAQVKNMMEKSSVSEQKNENIKTTKIYSPIDGFAKIADVKIGDYVKKEALIANVYSLDRSVRAYFPVTYKNAVKVDKNVEISIIKYPEKEFTGKISALEKPEPQGLPVTILFNDDTSNLDIQNGDSVIVKLKN